MKLLTRVLSRSGELSFDEAVDASDAGDAARYDWIRTILVEKDSRGAYIDFGCWTGGTLAQMRTMQPTKLAGLDLPGPWAEEARRRLPEAEIFEVADFSPLPSELIEGFDVALLLETIEHIPKGSEKRILETIARSLKSGGIFILSTPAAGPAALLDPAWWLVGHRHYAEKTLAALLAGAGFAEMEFRYSGNLLTCLDIIAMYLKKHLLHRRHVPSRRVARAINTGLQRTRGPVSSNIWVIATKQ